MSAGSTSIRPHNAVVWSVDEKSGMQAKSRINPTKPAVPGKPERREFEYKRNGTAVLFAALDVHDGAMAGWVTDSTRSENFVDVLGRPGAPDPQRTRPALHRRQPLRAQDRSRSLTFLEKNPHVHIHYTPTHASWLNQVELFFSILERRLLRRGEFASVDELADRIIAFIKDYNRRAAPVPLDLRRPTATSRVSHNDLRARALVGDSASRLGGMADTSRAIRHTSIPPRLRFPVMLSSDRSDGRGVTWLFGFWRGAPLTEDTQDKGTLDEGCRRLLRDAFRSAMNPDP